MALPNLKAVDEAEFEDFLARYPRPVTREVRGATKPSVVTLNDVTRGPWPASVVACYTEHWDGLRTDYKVLAEGWHRPGQSERQGGESPT